MKKLVVNKNDCGQNLIKFIKKTFPTFPKSAIYKAIRIKKIKINGKRCLVDSILNLELKCCFKGKHYGCVVLRAVPVVEAVANIVIVSQFLNQGKFNLENCNEKISS